MGGLGTSPAPQTSAAPLLDPPRLQDNLLVCPAPPSCYAAGCAGEYEENAGWNLEGAFLRSPSIYTKKKLAKTLIVVAFVICYKKKGDEGEEREGFWVTTRESEIEEGERGIGERCRNIGHGWGLCLVKRYMRARKREEEKSGSI